MSSHEIEPYAAARDAIFGWCIADSTRPEHRRAWGNAQALLKSGHDKIARMWQAVSGNIDNNIPDFEARNGAAIAKDTGRFPYGAAITEYFLLLPYGNTRYSDNKDYPRAIVSIVETGSAKMYIGPGTGVREKYTELGNAETDPKGVAAAINARLAEYYPQTSPVPVKMQSFVGRMVSKAAASARSALTS